MVDRLKASWDRLSGSQRAVMVIAVPVVTLAISYLLITWVLIGLGDAGIGSSCKGTCPAP